MSTVGNLANQLNNLSPCSNSSCCQKIDALQGELFRLKQKVESLEGQSTKADDAMKTARDALNAINPLRQDAAKAYDLGMSNKSEIDLLSAGLGAAAIALPTALDLISKAQYKIGEIGTQIGQLFAANSAGDTEARAAAAAADRKADAAAGAAGNAQRTADAAAGAAGNAQRTADAAAGAASNAQRTADAAAGAASNAQRTADAAANTADAAANTAGNAQSTADRAAGAAGNAQSTADRAAGAAGNAQSTADRAVGAAGNAQNTADRAAGAAEIAQSTADFGVNAASNAQSTADRAAGAAANAQSIAEAAAGAAGNAQNNSDRAIAIAQDAANRPAVQGEPGRNGIDGRNGKDGTNGKDGLNGKDGRDGRDATSDSVLTSRVGALESQVANLNTRAERDNVNPADKAEILQAIGTVGSAVSAMPETLASNSTFRSAATSAAAAGACQASRPGNCPGGTPDQLNNFWNNIQGWLSSGSGVLNNQILQSLSQTTNEIFKVVNTINKNVGTPIVGTLSTWAAATAEVVNRSQIVNILTYMSVLHNAYMLSNGLTQTLFSTISNSLSALGIKDTSTDPAGVPWDVGKIVDQWLEGFFKSVFGVAVVDGIKADWKKYNRIYQAAANILYSVQSLSHSILGALEVVGSHVAKIGNALQKFRAVGERAYGWMNDRPFFQNRFLTGMQSVQEVVSQVDQVASSVVSAQETLAQFGKQTEELQKSIAEDPAGKKSEPQPEAAATKAAAEAAKLASKSPDISETDQIKP